MGTLGGNFLKRARLLLQKIIEAFGNEPNVELVIVSGNIPLPPSQYNNVHIFDKVPQLDILKHANVMINHGGLNSISECIHAGVPMLIYPLIRKCDHHGNAARVVANGFGLGGNISNDTPKDIKKKVDTILENQVCKPVLSSQLDHLLADQLKFNYVIEQTLKARI